MCAMPRIRPKLPHYAVLPCYVTAWMFSIVCMLMTNVVSGEETAAEAGESNQISMADGRLTLLAEGKWKRVKPKVRIIEHEFSVPPVDGDTIPGRITMMSARGTVQENLDRWMGQFSQPDDRQTADVAKVSQREISGLSVHVVDMEGIYHDRRGPFTPAVLRKDYRMLGVIIETEEAGKQFVKFYGPKKTVTENLKSFHKMIDALAWNP